MSDFLDRLAARAIGGEAAALAPRVLSLFEPLQRAPLMPQPDEGDASSRRNPSASAASVTPPVAATPSRSAPATTDVPRVAAVAVESAPALIPAPVAAHTPAAPALNVRSAVTSPPSPLVERQVVAPPVTRLPAPSPVRPRETRLAVEPPAPSVRAGEVDGALLAAPTPVFGAARAAERPDPLAHAAAPRARLAPADGRSSSSEPVVHVSIGRLEVRAAPAASPAPSRRDAPQPASLDDYLRQRGKVSP